jgi:hypothetical protein
MTRTAGCRSGVANRPDLVMDVKPGVAPRWPSRSSPGEDLRAERCAITSAAARRTATRRATSSPTSSRRTSSRRSAATAPRSTARRSTRGAAQGRQDGKMRRRRRWATRSRSYADVFVQRRHGGERARSIARSSRSTSKAVDALHRALAETPEGVAAYKQLGELTSAGPARHPRALLPARGEGEPEAGSCGASWRSTPRPSRSAETADMFGEHGREPGMGDEWRAAPRRAGRPRSTRVARPGEVRRGDARSRARLRGGPGPDPVEGGEGRSSRRTTG